MTNIRAYFNMNIIFEQESNYKHSLPEILNERLRFKGSEFLFNFFTIIKCIFPQKASSKTNYGPKHDKTHLHGCQTVNL